MTAAMQLFSALLALFVLLAAAVIAADRLTGGRLGVWAGVKDIAAAASAAVAVAATLGSLYFSEVAHFTPCRLCWYQRIFIYPLAVILPIAVLRRDRKIFIYTLPLSLIGLSVSVWHWLVEHVDAFAGAGACDLANPCNLVWFEEFGFVTLAFMAGCAQLFLAVIAASSLIDARAERRAEHNLTGHASASPALQGRVSESS